MKNWALLVESFLSEASISCWDRAVKVRGGEVDVYRNPSKSEFHKLFKMEEAGRLLLCRNGDVLVFTAEVTHGDIDDAYKKECDDTYTFPTALCAPGWLDLAHILEFDYEIAVAAVQKYRNSPNIAKMFGRKFAFVGENANMEEVPIDDLMARWAEHVEQFRAANG